MSDDEQSRALVRKVYTGEVLSRPGDLTFELAIEGAIYERWTRQIRELQKALLLGVAVAYHPAARAISTADVIDPEPGD